MKFIFILYIIAFNILEIRSSGSFSRMVESLNFSAISNVSFAHEDSLYFVNSIARATYILLNRLSDFRYSFSSAMAPLGELNLIIAKSIALLQVEKDIESAQAQVLQLALPETQLAWFIEPNSSFGNDNCRHYKSGFAKSSPMFCSLRTIIGQLYHGQIEKSKISLGNHFVATTYCPRLLTSKWFRKTNLDAFAPCKDELKDTCNSYSNKLKVKSFAGLEALNTLTVIHHKTEVMLNAVLLNRNGRRLQKLQKRIIEFSKVRYLGTQILLDYLPKPHLFFLYTSGRKTYFVYETEYISGLILSQAEAPWLPLTDTQRPQFFNRLIVISKGYLLSGNNLARFVCEGQLDEAHISSYPSSCFELNLQYAPSNGTVLEFLYNEWAVAAYGGLELYCRGRRRYLLTHFNKTRMLFVGGSSFQIPASDPRIRRTCARVSGTDHPAKITPLGSIEMHQFLSERNGVFTVVDAAAITFHKLNFNIQVHVLNEFLQQHSYAVLFEIFERHKHEYPILTHFSTKFCQRPFCNYLKGGKDIKFWFGAAVLTQSFIQDLWRKVVIKDPKHLWLDLLVGFRFQWDIQHLRVVYALFHGASLVQVFKHFFGEYI